MPEVAGPAVDFKPEAVFNEQNVPTPGGAMLVIHPDQDAVISRCAVGAFMLANREDGKFVYKTLTFIAPSQVIWQRSEDETFELLLTGLSQARGKDVNEGERDQLRRKFKFTRLAGISSDAVAGAIETGEKHQFVFLPWAANYRDGLTAVRAGQTTVRLEEDTWVPHTAALARKLIDVARTKNCYILMATPFKAPTTQENNQVLLDVEDLAVAGLRDDTQDEVMSQLARWAAMAVSGRGAEALAQLEAKKLPELTKKQARMQIHSSSGDHERAAELIRELLQQMTVTAGAAVQWADICLKGDDRRTAAQLIAANLEALTDERDLQEALRISTQTQDSALVDRAWNRLQGLFPASSALQFDAEARLLQICALAHTPQQALAISQIGFAAHHVHLVGQLDIAGQLDYMPLLEHVQQQYPEHRELALMCFASHAEAVDDVSSAWGLVSELIPQTRFSMAAARLALRTMSKLLLSGLVRPEDSDMYRIPLEAVLAHLSEHPQDGETRGRLLNTLEVERSGNVGFPLLVALALNMLRQEEAPGPEPAKHPVAEPQEFREFLARVGVFTGRNGVIDARKPLPADVVGPNAAGLTRLLQESLEQEMLEKRSSSALRDLDFQAGLLPCVARLVPGETGDIHALRALAGRYSLLGENQRARDLAEAILQAAGDSPARKRMAWGAYADIYLRSASVSDALVGIICAGATQAQLSPSNLAYEVYTQFRAIRDTGLVDQASSLLQRYRKLLAASGTSEIQRNRLGVIELTLRLKQSSRKDVTALLSMLEQAHALLEQALKLEDELFAAAFLFAQLTALVELAGQYIPADSDSLKEKALAACDVETATYLRTVSNARPALNDLVDLHNRVSGARYSSDAPSDATALQIGAHRLLRPANPELAVATVFLGCEVLADRGVRPASPAAPLTATWPLQYAQGLAAQESLTVLMLALDDEGEIVTAWTESGSAQVVRPTATQPSARERLRTWAQTYPYRYGNISPGKQEFDERSQTQKEVTDAEFYASIRPLNIPMPASSRVLVVAEPELAQVTLNLILKDKEFAGYSTAMAMVPSLSWLASTRQRPAGGDGRRLAWLSGGANNDPRDAMGQVFDRTQSALQQHGIVLNANTQLPNDFEGAQMVIVTAHGQLGTDGRFIHRVVDEGRLKESPVDLANALAGVELVILFVCSGGRVDKHPTVSTTVGLPKMLLSSKCRTVIASPWPLESLVPGWWLPAFLDAWAAGATAMDACHAANIQVNSMHAYQPQRSLAMMVYGDPLLQSSPGAT